MKNRKAILMVTLFEFLGNEEIENVITCLNFEIDKVVFFGYQEEINRQKQRLDRFLRKYCCVEEISFVPLSHKNVQLVTKVMGKEISSEKSKGSDIYFDVTGGESLILVAFGMLSTKYETPMHFYDIEKNKLFEIDEGIDRSISENVNKRVIWLNIDMWIELKGGVINYGLQKDYKEIDFPSFKADIEKLWSFMQEYPALWNPLAQFIRKNLKPEEGLVIEAESNELKSSLEQSLTKLNSVPKLRRLLRRLSEINIIKDYQYDDSKCRFRYKNESVLSCLTSGGSVLELLVFFEQTEYADDCRVGVHIDWDGIIHPETGVDVVNEVDVLTLNGNIPTFISCKTGNMSSGQVLNALYELDTVADKFGGKYSKKYLASLQCIPEVYINRAEEMNISIYQMAHSCGDFE